MRGWCWSSRVVLAVAAARGGDADPTDAGVGTLVDSDTASYRATQQVREAFGEEPVVVLAEGDLQELILTANIFRLLRLEGCLSGNVPKGAKPIPGPARSWPSSTRSSSSPARRPSSTRRWSRSTASCGGSRERVPPRAVPGIPPLRSRPGTASPACPRLDNPEFVATVVFDLSRARGTPKARLAYLFPNSRSAQIVVRLRPDLSEAERHRAIELIEAAVDDTTPRKACAEQRASRRPASSCEGGSYVVSGAPVVVDGVARALKDALLVLFAVAVVVMALTLLLVFRSRLRLLPLALALAAAALTFGLLGLVRRLADDGLDRRPADPDRPRRRLRDPAPGPLRRGGRRTAPAGRRGGRLAATAGGPTIATACLATAAGFLALQLSPIPMVRSFGLLLDRRRRDRFRPALDRGFAALSLSSRRARECRSQGPARRSTASARPPALASHLATLRDGRVLGDRLWPWPSLGLGRRHSDRDQPPTSASWRRRASMRCAN